MIAISKCIEHAGHCKSCLRSGADMRRASHASRCLGMLCAPLLPEAVRLLAHERPQLRQEEPVEVRVAALAEELPHVLVRQALDRERLKLEQRRLRGVAVNRDDLLRAVHDLHTAHACADRALAGTSCILDRTMPRRVRLTTHKWLRSDAHTKRGNWHKLQGMTQAARPGARG
jgi:hypothetical protein